MAHDVGEGSYIRFGTLLGSNPGTHFRMTDIKWGSIKRGDPADATHLLSTAMEYIASGVYDPGEASVDVQFDPSLLSSVISHVQSASTAQVVTFIFANGGTSQAAYSTYGTLQEFEAGANRTDVMTGTIKIKLSGVIGTATP